MKLYTYFRASELAKEFDERESRSYYGSFDETYRQKCARRKRQSITIRDGLIGRFERIELKVQNLQNDIDIYSLKEMDWDENGLL